MALYPLLPHADQQTIDAYVFLTFIGHRRGAQKAIISREASTLVEQVAELRERCAEDLCGDNRMLDWQRAAPTLLRMAKTEHFVPCAQHYTMAEDGLFSQMHGTTHYTVAAAKPVATDDLINALTALTYPDKGFIR